MNNRAQTQPIITLVTLMLVMVTGLTVMDTVNDDLAEAEVESGEMTQAELEKAEAEFQRTVEGGVTALTGIVASFLLGSGVNRRASRAVATRAALNP